jgi:DNA-directed RNA polymerase specialized sigma24 family protein
MARPLTKCRKDGRRYVRRPDIESKIEVAFGQPLSVLIERAAISDSKAANYLPSECLVYLVREARRNNDDRKVDDLISLLFIRCEKLVRAKLRRDSFENPDEVVDEVLEQLGELFAIDGTDQDKKLKLDIYECVFNKACLALCINAINREFRRTDNTVSLTPECDEDESPAHESLMLRVAKLKAPAASVIDAEELEKLRRAIEALPKDERDAVVLVHLLGHDAASDDKTKTTAATICGVTGRTIFNRLARAAKKLAQFMEKL